MPFDVFGMCYALFDLQATVEPQVLDDLGLVRGAMHLIDEAQHAAIVRAVRDSIVNTAAGGSGANTMIGVASLGGTACFTSRVGRDDFGAAYVRSLSDAGVRPNLRQGDGATGICVVLITPDKERTMCTYLGEGRRLTPSDVVLGDLRQSRMLYVTGYLWDTDDQKAAVIAAVAEARRFGIRVALSLADRFCIDRHRDDFTGILGGDVDVVFGNQDEALLLSGESEPAAAASALGARGTLAFVTLGANGALVSRGGDVTQVPAVAVEPVDTTGAGDAFAAGALFGLTHGHDALEAARLGSALAAHVVSRMGPRPDAEIARKMSPRCAE